MTISKETTRTIISDPNHESTTSIPRTIETIIVHEEGQEFVNETIAIRTRDGRLIADPVKEGLYACPCGTGPWAKEAVTFCSCGSIVCRAACTEFDNEDPRCKRCHRKELPKRVLRSITGALRWMLRVPR
jgi:hypothetical protein